MLSDYQSVYKQIITGGESWIYAYDQEKTDKSSEYRLKGETKPKRPRQSRSKIKKQKAKRPELWANNTWILYHDNSPLHTALILREFFVKNSTHVVPQPPYSTDLAP